MGHLNHRLFVERPTGDLQPDGQPLRVQPARHRNRGVAGEVEDLPAEGSLAPDSYEVRPGDDRAEVIARMAR